MEVDVIGLVAAEGDLGREGNPWSRGGRPSSRRFTSGDWEANGGEHRGAEGGEEDGADATAPGEEREPVAEEVADDDVGFGGVEEGGERFG